MEIKRQILARNGLLEYLGGISPAQVSASAYVAPRPLRGGPVAVLPPELSSQDLPEPVIRAIGESETGAVVFSGPAGGILVLPPFHLSVDAFYEGLETAPLVALLEAPRGLGIVLVRLEGYAVGVFSGSELLSSKVGTAHIHGRHHKGGSSQGRFARHREKQMEAFFTRVCTHLREIFEPLDSRIEYVLYGGTRETVLAFRQQCRYSGDYDSRTLVCLLNPRQPNQSALWSGLDEACRSHLVLWQNQPL